MSDINKPATVKVVIGGTYTFYSEVQQSDLPPEERLRRFTGQNVLVVSLLWAGDGESSPRYMVRASDGTEFEAHIEELNGWDKALGQFYEPEDEGVAAPSSFEAHYDIPGQGHDEL